MADVYVYSGATGLGDGSSWANAYTSFYTAYNRTGAAAGDHYWLHHAHYETSAASISRSIRGNRDATDWVFCVDGGVAGPDFATADLRDTAVLESADGMNVNWYSASNSGHIRVHGIKFFVGGVPTFGLYGGVFEECEFHLTREHHDMTLRLNNGIKIFNCSVWFKVFGQAVFWRDSDFEWTNDPSRPFLLPGSTIPTQVLKSNATQGDRGNIRFTGMDFGEIQLLVQSGGAGFARFRQCKIAAGAVTTPEWNQGAQVGFVEFIQCSSNTTARNERHAFGCAQTTETTIVRDGGASDFGTDYSWKLTSNAYLKRESAFETSEVHVYNDVVGVPRTASVHVLSNQILTDREIWLEVEYYGSNQHRRYLRAHDGAGVLDVGTAQPASTASWPQEALLGTPVKQVLEVTFTPMLEGLVRLRVRLGKPDATVFVCPAAELTNA